MITFVKYKRWAFKRLERDYWRATSPNGNFTFCIRFPGGIPELKERVDLWRSIIDNDTY